MNKTAEELGLKNTHFVTPHGLDDNEHYTTAYELAVLTDYALKNEKLPCMIRHCSPGYSIRACLKMLSVIIHFTESIFKHAPGFFIHISFIHIFFPQHIQE